MSSRVESSHINDIALLIVDVQKGLFEKSTPIFRAKELLNNINSMVKRAHDAGSVVVYIQHANERDLAQGSDGWQLHPDLHPVVDDLRAHKRKANAFEDTPLDAELRSRGVHRVVVTGLVSHGCVQYTCLGATKLGYEVTLISDGHSSFSSTPQKMIDKCHDKAAACNVKLVPTQEMDFGMT